MATAEFTKFAGILSAALSQHHLLGFEILNWNSSPPLALLGLVCMNKFAVNVKAQRPFLTFPGEKLFSVGMGS